MFDFLKKLPIYIENIESQIRDNQFPNRVEYLSIIREITEDQYRFVISSFFEGVELIYRAKKYQRVNNLFLIISIISYLIGLCLPYCGDRITFPMSELSLDHLLFVLGTLCMLITILISFAFNAIKGTIYRLFSEIERFEPPDKELQQYSKLPKTLRRGIK